MISLFLRTLALVALAVCPLLSHAELKAFEDTIAQRTQACTACHGDQGRAQPGMLSLAGVNKAELLKKMTDYKTGVMPSTIVQQLAKGYSDEQLAALATYFSSQKK